MEYKHFSHQHMLTLYQVQAGQQFQCHGCNLPCNDSIFACWSCNFFLHDRCGNANRYVNHPSHPAHPLLLLPSPTYCSGSFICNACGAPGSAFSYCCALCEVDLHVPCAYLPLNMRHPAHQHELRLGFGSSNGPTFSDCCKLCGKEMGSRNWVYLCERSECCFRVHTYCGGSEVKAGLYGDERREDVRAEPTAEEVVLEMSRLQMELQMAHALADIIAST